MLEERCNQCKYFEINLQDMKQGACHRFPPAWVIVPTPQGLQQACALPLVLAEGACGEFRPKILQ